MVDTPPAPQRLRCVVHGVVQGVGFRPFVYRLAEEYSLKGWILNDVNGVELEVEGNLESLTEFLRRLESDIPPLAIIQSMEFSWLEAIGFTGFEIKESSRIGEKRVLILPDITTCEDCVKDTLEKGGRRYRYPFTNCTNCGPRYSIINGLPYDRPLTSMAIFPLCDECDEEYHDPTNRRFHAQPNACEKCGPELELWNEQGEVLGLGDTALLGAINAISEGWVVALKGIGGFQLIVDARNDDAIARLRKRKAREAKPLAVMFPSIEDVRESCHLSVEEERTLTSPAAPIVLLDKLRGATGLSRQLAPDNPRLGAMLPTTPLHHLLLDGLGFGVVATSGNLSDEPMAIKNNEAMERLRGIADLWLVNDRPIARHVDDSIMRVRNGREVVLRRARGFAPLPIHLTGDVGKTVSQHTIVGVGAHLKNTIAITSGARVFVSQHIGDLNTAPAVSAFERVLVDLQEILEVEPTVVACDLHPDYLSSREAEKLARNKGMKLIQIQHHEAHIASAMSENQLEGEVLGLSWDGVGLGYDNTIWGGEFLLGGYNGFRRIGHLRTFPLPGGDLAAKETRRAALGLLHEAGLVGDSLEGWEDSELRLVTATLEKGVNSPRTSSMGRLFDAIAGLIGIRDENRYEGEAPMALEHILPKNAPDIPPYSFSIDEEVSENGDAILVVDWEPMLHQLLQDRSEGLDASYISARFHNGLVHLAVEMAKKCDTTDVVLSGGVFQNLYLAERIVFELLSEGFKPHTHQRVPPNDGGLSLGQVIMAAHLMKEM